MCISKLMYLRSVGKLYFFYITIGIKIPFFRVSVTIEPGRSLLQFATTNCLTSVRHLMWKCSGGKARGLFSESLDNLEESSTSSSRDFTEGKC